MGDDFVLDPRLALDTIPVTDLALCNVLLMNESRYPWLILVPARAGVSELHDLESADRATLVEEVALASQVVKSLFAPEKVNVGALGNIVRQLHVHIVARNVGDPAWPGPVWGHSPAVPYDDVTAENLSREIATALERGLHSPR
jgi:diadenosine tetraphosphate (Ap4A) HIT family hydrolase